MRFQPVLTPSAIGYERDCEVTGILHLFLNDSLHLLTLILRHREVEFVMHLKDEFCLQSLSLQSLPNANHSHLHYIGCCALNGSIDSIAFGKGANGAILGVDIRQITPSAHDGLSIAFLASLVLASLYELLYLREGFKIAVYELFFLATVDV